MHEVLETIKSLHEKVSSQSQNPEAFSRITKSQNEKKIKKRKSDLKNELQKQKDHEKILSSCLSECKEFIQHVEHSLKNIAQDSEGTEEERLQKVEHIGSEALNKSTELLKEIKKWSDKVDEAEISEQAEYSYQEMESLGDQIKNAVNKRVQALQEQVYQKKNGFSFKRTITRISWYFQTFW